MPITFSSFSDLVYEYKIKKIVINFYNIKLAKKYVKLLESIIKSL